MAFCGFWVPPALVAAVCMSACAGRLAARPDVYHAEKATIQRQNYTLNPVLVKPVSPEASPVLIMFASGDGGLMGLSKTILQHLANGGHYVAGFSSQEALRSIKGSRARIPYSEAGDHLGWAISEAKAKLGLPPETPIIVTGISRGANIVMVAANSRATKDHIIGAVAIALTRVLDHLSLPKSALRMLGFKVDKQQRLQTYAMIESITIPLAIIQSTNDSYVPSAESRKLLGPDTPTRRLYEVKSDGHNFEGGEAEMLHDLDNTLNWITSRK